MTMVSEAYALPAPHKAAPVDAATIPEEAWRTHKVCYVYAAMILPRGSITPRSFALIEAGTADRKVAKEEARFETPGERLMAIENGHRRDANPPKSKSKKAPAKKTKAAAEAEGTPADGDS